MSRALGTALALVAAGIGVLFLTPDWAVWGAFLGNALILVGVIAAVVVFVRERRSRNVNAQSPPSS